MKEWTARFPSPSDVECAYSPMHWGYAMSNPERAYMAECPTLRQYADAFGLPHAAMWVRIQVTQLYGASSNRDKGVSDGIKLFADCFASEVAGYKLSELMLFFARYKAGRYDNSYASFDSKRIGNAFFKEFLKERVHEIDKAERARVQREIEERRFTPPEGHSSLSWYQELKSRADAGDTEAAGMLNLNL